MYRYRTFFYGPGYGRGMGYGRGIGRGFGRGLGSGRRFISPNCDFFPDRPRGWWAMPQYQTTPPQEAVWDSMTGEPTSIEAIDYEISMVEKQMEELRKEIEHLKALKNK